MRWDYFLMPVAVKMPSFDGELQALARGNLLEINIPASGRCDNTCLGAPGVSVVGRTAGLFWVKSCLAVARRHFRFASAIGP
jgi:hypothetical protein